MKLYFLFENVKRHKTKVLGNNNKAFGMHLFLENLQIKIYFLFENVKRHKNKVLGNNNKAFGMQVRKQSQKNIRQK